MTTQEWTITDWIKLLNQQAHQYRKYRESLYNQVNISRKKMILDIGCGTGVITKDIAVLTKGDVYGVDIDKEKLDVAKCSIPVIQGDAVNLPFKDNTFDLVVFCLLLIHMKEQQKAVNEMARVCKKNGVVLATMEPDYQGTMRYPDLNSGIMLQSLKDMGCDFYTGRKLRALFSEAGLTPEVGVHMFDIDLLNEDVSEQVQWFLDRFWLIERSLKRGGWTVIEINEYKQTQLELIKKKELFSFMPVMYCIGKK
ncbi:MAG: methyltransferase domain-containing protein [Candidatus Methanofastidiosia archaeon]|jgi:SAM-dependent methyltransferase